MDARKEFYLPEESKQRPKEWKREGVWVPVRGRLRLERIIHAEACAKILIYRDHLCGISMSAYLTQVYATYSFIFHIFPGIQSRGHQFRTYRDTEACHAAISQVFRVDSEQVR